VQSEAARAWDCSSMTSWRKREWHQPSHARKSSSLAALTLTCGGVSELSGLTGQKPERTALACCAQVDLC